MVMTNPMTGRLRLPAISGAVAAHVAVQPFAACGTGSAPAVAPYGCLVAPIVRTVDGTGLSMTGAVTPISKAALGDTPGTSTWSPPV